MRSLSKYMIRAAIGPFIFVTMVLTGVIWIVQALRFVDEIINYDMTIGAFTYISVLLLPQLLPVTMPIGLFCGMLYAYWRLSTDSELVVMRAAGLSRMHLARPGIMLGVACAVIVGSMTFYFMPLANTTMRDTRFAWHYIYSTLVLREQQFTPLQTRLTVYVRERHPGGELRGLLIQDDRDQTKTVTMMAERGTIIRSDDGPKILLLQGNRQERDRKTGDVSLLFFDSYNVEVNMFGSSVPIRPKKLEELSFLTLLRAGDGLTGDAYWRQQAEAHKRVALPLLALTFSLIAIAAILSGEFDRRGLGRRIFVASVSAGLVQGAALALVQAGGSSPFALVLLYLLILGGMGISLYLIRPGAGGKAPPIDTRPGPMAGQPAGGD
ncbi:MAG: LPS export ABC transporter permease LptF [Minwuia sp.]|nr:LPS export ABC transporter permease LptF [Minwuia sp.]